MTTPVQLSMSIGGNITAPLTPGNVAMVTISAYNPNSTDVTLASVAPTLGAPAPQWAGSLSIVSQTLTVPAGQDVPILVFALVSHVPRVGKPSFTMQVGAVANDSAGNQSLVSQTLAFYPYGTAPESLVTLTSGLVAPLEDYSQSLDSEYTPFFGF